MFHRHRGAASRWWKVELPLFPMTWTDKLFNPAHNFQPISNLHRVRQTLTTTSNLRQVRELSANSTLSLGRLKEVLASSINSNLEVQGSFGEAHLKFAVRLTLHLWVIHTLIHVRNSNTHRVKQVLTSLANAVVCLNSVLMVSPRLCVSLCLQLFQRHVSQTIYPLRRVKVQGRHFLSNVRRGVR